ncbi:hypothetical protein D3C80_1888150 [compost metagenome]
MESLYGISIINAVAIVLPEWHGIRHFVRLSVEAWRTAEIRDQPNKSGMELCNRGRPKVEGRSATIAAKTHHSMIMEIEQDFDPGSIGNG